MYKALYTDIEKSVVREKKIDPLGRCSLRIGNHGPCFSTDEIDRFKTEMSMVSAPP